MRAVQLKEFTQNVDAVTVSDVPDPRGGSDVVVRIEAAGIHPSDLVNIRGGFPYTTLPRIVGRDFAGRVVQGPPHLLDRDVWGVGGGDLGFTHDGSHAEYIQLPEDAVALRPPNLSPADAASSGLPYVTAWLALVQRAGITRNEVVVVSGAAGGVGTAAIEIVNYVGARAIALVLDESEVAGVDPKKVLAIARSDLGNVEQVVRDTTSGNGCDIALNVVGAPLFEPLLASLAECGRMPIVSGVAGRVVDHFDLLNFYRRDLTLHGINTAGKHFTASNTARILTELHAGFEAQQLAGSAYRNFSARGGKPRVRALCLRGGPENRPRAVEPPLGNTNHQLAARVLRRID